MGATLEDGHAKAASDAFQLAWSWKRLRSNRPWFMLISFLTVALLAIPILWVPRHVRDDLAVAGVASSVLSIESCRWLFEDIFRIGAMKVGLPGITGVALCSTPLFEAVPRIWADGNVGKLPLLPYSAMTGSGIMWLAYGILQNSMVIWVPNLVGTILGIIYMLVFLKFCPPGADWLPMKSVHHIAFCIGVSVVTASVVILLPFKLTVNVLGTLGSAVTLAMFAGPLAAVRTVLTDRSTKSLPLGFTCVVTLNTALWSFYGLIISHDPFVYVPNGIGLLLGCVQLSLFFRFGFAG